MVEAGLGLTNRRLPGSIDLWLLSSSCFLGLSELQRLLRQQALFGCWFLCGHGLHISPSPPATPSFSAVSLFGRLNDARPSPKQPATQPGASQLAAHCLFALGEHFVFISFPCRRFTAAPLSNPHRCELHCKKGPGAPQWQAERLPPIRVCSFPSCSLGFGHCLVACSARAALCLCVALECCFRGPSCRSNRTLCR